MEKQVSFHERLFEISLFNLSNIKQAYNEVLRLEHIVHLSINVIDPDYKIMFLSSKPNTGINVCGTDLWKHDKSISPEIFLHKEFYFWDDCYARPVFLELKKAKEMENGIRCGFVVREVVDGFIIMYSYGLDCDSLALRSDLPQFEKYFVKMGRKSFCRIYEVYSKAAGSVKIIKEEKIAKAI